MERAGGGRGEQPWPPGDADQPEAARTRGGPWATVAGDYGADGDGERNGTNARPASRGEYPRTVWTKMEVRNTVPTRMPVTPSITVVADTSDSPSTCGAGRRLAARGSRQMNAANRAETVREIRSGRTTSRAGGGAEP